MVCVKFGGTSLADAAQFKKVKRIIESDPKRKFVVVSAPGKRFSGDIKITDMLEEVWKRALRGGRIDLAMKPVTERFSEIACKLKLEFDADKDDASDDAEKDDENGEDVDPKEGEGE